MDEQRDIEINLDLVYLNTDHSYGNWERRQNIRKSSLHKSKTTKGRKFAETIMSARQPERANQVQIRRQAEPTDRALIRRQAETTNRALIRRQAETTNRALIRRQAEPAARVQARAAAAIAARRRQVRRQRIAAAICLLLLIGAAAVVLPKVLVNDSSRDNTSNVTMQDKTAAMVQDTFIVEGLPLSVYTKHPAWEEDFLTINEYSRPGDLLHSVKSIFVHYTANPGTSAAQNRSYFEQLKDTHITSASSHFIIGYDGEIIQCIPLDEIGYAVATRNNDSISIECCYVDSDGSFTEETYQSLVTLLAWLADSYSLTEDDILRHYDCGGKECPVYYVENESAWHTLKDDVTAALVNDKSM
jgi:hypothetical protein